ncbi:Ig-like domain-containing protein [Ancylomarina sp.]|uniref:Ig-like domain-containing protein n=1 Tax=Ancylomarina sp. TaxID=1970196 RepID=UPI0035623276
MFYTYKSYQNEGLGILSRLSKQAVLSILLLGCSFGCQKGDDTSAPLSITSTNIADGATDVDLKSEIRLDFNEAMDASTLTTSTFVIQRGVKIISGTVTCSSKTATFTPNYDLEAYTKYTCTITTGVISATGNALDNVYSWSFTTGVAPDEIAPTVVENSPLEAETYVLYDSHITVKFDEEMDLATINTSTFLIKNDDVMVSGTVSLGRNKAEFKPNAELSPGTIYTCTITKEAADLAGNTIENQHVWSFTTIPETISFNEGIQPIFKAQNCISCHNASRNPDLRNSNAYNSLINGQFVDATNPEGSRIVEMLNGSYHKDFTTQKDKQLILDWIKQGAKNN